VQSSVKYVNQPDYDFDVTGITEATAKEMKAIKPKSVIRALRVYARQEEVIERSPDAKECLPVS
jgi:hypothetical protein